MIKLRTSSAKFIALLLAYLPFRFCIYFLAIKIRVPHTNLIELASEIFVFAGIGILLVSGGPTTWKKCLQPKQWPVVIKLAIALVTWGLITLSFTPVAMSQAGRGLRLDFLGIGILLTLWLLPVRSEEKAWLFDLALCGLLVIAGVGLVELVLGPHITGWLGFSPNAFLAGTIHQVHSLLPTPNMFGSAMVVLAALLFRRNPKPNIGIMAIVGILVGSSFSRSAWLALAILGAFWFFACLRKGSFNWSVGFLALGLAIGIGYGTLRYHGSLYTVATHDQSTSQHQKAYASALAGSRRFGNYWLIGDGIGSAGPATFRSDQGIRIAESWYIQLFQEIGLIGLGLFVALMAALTQQLYAVGEPVLAAMTVALSVNAMFLHIWADDRFVHILFWTMAGLALCATDKATNKSRAKL